MATLAFSLAGQVVGGLLGGPIGATIGRAVGALAGAAVDEALFGDKREARPQTGADIRLSGSSEGVPIPRVYGWSRLAGNIIWATELEELTTETAGAKGFGPPPEQPEPVVAAGFAVALCEGPVSRIGRIWADGQILELEGLSYRLYRGGENQLPDSLIEAKQGAGNAPAYRGICTIVFEQLPLNRFGNRIPNISVEVCRAVGALEPAIRAMTLIPGATEFGYDPIPRVRLVGPGRTASENTHLAKGVSDWTLSLDELQELCPNLERVALVISWFGDDLRCGQCDIAPRVEAGSRTVPGTSWSVAGISRGSTQVVTNHAGGPAYGGTPSDAAVLAAIADLKARGLGVTLYPLMMMDIPAGNPMGQPAYPWRGRIACSAGADGTGTAASEVAAFVPGYRAFVLHYAELADAAGGVDAFVIGSEMRGMTTVRDGAGNYPFVAALVDLAEDVRAVVGGGTRLTYAADWSEYSGHQPGGGVKRFHLDPLWASDDIDAVGIDNYMPSADWRDGTDHADAELGGPYDPAYLRANIGGGEGFDWYYASDADRIAGLRTPITDGTYGEPFVWRYKDLASWWGNPHHDRPGGVRSPTPTAWVPGSKPIWFTELGCGAVDKGANQPNVFLDAKSVESGRPHFSTAAPDPLAQRQFLRAHLEHWADPTANPEAAEYDGRMVDTDHVYLWTWDARPYPAFPADAASWADGVNHPTGHWLTGRLGAAAADEMAAAVASDYGVTLAGEAAAPLIHGLTLEGNVTCRDALAPVSAATGLAVCDTADGLRLGAPSQHAALAVVTDTLVDDERRPLAQRRRADPAEAVGQLTLTYADRERAYLAGTATAIHPAGGIAIAERTGLVLDLAGSRTAAERALQAAADRPDTLEVTLPFSLMALEAGDVIAAGGQAEGPFEITEIRDGAARRIVARALPPKVAASVVDGRAASGLAAPVAMAIPALAAAHLPGMPGDTQSRLLLAAMASPWPGRVLATDEETGAELARLGRSAALGELAAPLAPGRPFAWDDTSAVEVTLYGGHLASADDEVVLAGTNRIAIETDTGGWEIVGFAEADLVAPATYRLTRLLRGQGGTDPEIGPAGAGSRVVVLDTRTVPVPVPAAWLGTDRALRFYAGPSDPEGHAVTAEIGLGPVLPLPPAHITARRAPGSDDVLLSWIRRSRADSDGWAVADAPLDAAPEAYVITILDGSAPVRTIEVSTPAVTYTAAEQAADFGAPPDGFAFTIAQLSPVYGPGHAATGEFDA